MYIVTLYGSHRRFNKPIVIDQYWIEEDSPIVRKEIIDSLKSRMEITLYNPSLFIDDEQNYYEWEVLSDWHDPNFYRITINEDCFNLFDVFKE
ncbi:hypothetical protein [Facklamia hominis]